MRRRHVEALAIERGGGTAIGGAKTRELLGLELVVDVLIYRSDVRGINIGRSGAGDGRVGVVRSTVGRFLRRPAGTEIRRCSVGSAKICPVDIPGLGEVGMRLCMGLRLCLCLGLGLGLRRLCLCLRGKSQQTGYGATALGRGGANLFLLSKVRPHRLHTVPAFNDIRL